MRKGAVLCIVLLMLPYSLMAAEDALALGSILEINAIAQAPELSMASWTAGQKQGLP